ncbi:MAG: NUDIX hydrolase [Bacteroidales bacterium]|nr:NUDIX hydrolase [Bacteroidales bacterium]
MEKQMNYCYEYPHPAVTTDSVVFGFDGKDLHILLIERGADPFKGSWALPGGFIKMDETAEEGARRELFEETNVRDIFLEQFHTFSKVGRDPRERVITIAFYALVRKGDFEVIAGDDAARARWFIVDELPPLAFDHDEIIETAKDAIRRRLKLDPIAFRLLDESFSLPELQRLYELISGRTYDRRNFQKKMLSSGYLERVDFNEEIKFCHLSSLDAKYLVEPGELPKGALPKNEKGSGRKPHTFSFLSKKFENSDDKDKDLFNP